MAIERNNMPGVAGAVPGRTRRDAITAIGATALAGIAVAAFAAPDQAANLQFEGDAHLIALCAQMDALEHRYAAVCKAELRGYEEELSQLSAAQRPIVERISETPARSFAGIQAKARSLAGWAPDLLEPDNDHDIVGLLAASILSDIVREG